MAEKRKGISLDPSAFAAAAVPVPDPVAVATASRTHLAAVSTDEIASSELPRKGSVKATGRAGRVQITGHFPAERRRRMKVLSAMTGRTIEDLLDEAMEDLLAKHQA